MTFLYSARVQLLVDERNSIQHRYGTIDAITMDFYLETLFGFIGEILLIEFSTDINEFVRSTLDQDVWSKCRFVKNEQEQSLEREILSVVSLLTKFDGGFLSDNGGRSVTISRQYNEKSAVSKR